MACREEASSGWRVEPSSGTWRFSDMPRVADSCVLRLSLVMFLWKSLASEGSSSTPRAK